MDNLPITMGDPGELGPPIVPRPVIPIQGPTFDPIPIQGPVFTGTPSSTASFVMCQQGQEAIPLRDVGREANPLQDIGQNPAGDRSRSPANLQQYLADARSVPIPLENSSFNCSNLTGDMSELLRHDPEWQGRQQLKMHYEAELQNAEARQLEKFQRELSEQEKKHEEEGLRMVEQANYAFQQTQSQMQYAVVEADNQLRAQLAQEIGGVESRMSGEARLEFQNAVQMVTHQCREAFREEYKTELAAREQQFGNVQQQVKQDVARQFLQMQAEATRQQANDRQAYANRCSQLETKVAQAESVAEQIQMAAREQARMNDERERMATAAQNAFLEVKEVANDEMAKSEFWKTESQQILHHYREEVAEVQKQRTEVFESQQNNDRYGVEARQHIAEIEKHYAHRITGLEMNVQRQTEWAHKQNDKYKQELAAEAAARKVTQQAPPLPPPNYSPPPLQQPFESFWENLQHQLPKTPPRKEAMPQQWATFQSLPSEAKVDSERENVPPQPNFASSQSNLKWVLAEDVPPPPLPGPFKKVSLAPFLSKGFKIGDLKGQEPAQVPKLGLTGLPSTARPAPMPAETIRPLGLNSDSEGEEEKFTRRRTNVKEMKIDPLPTATTLRKWSSDLLTEACRCSNRPKLRTTVFMREAFMADSIDGFETIPPKWDQFDTELCAALMKIATGASLRELLQYREACARRLIAVSGRAVLILIM